jgi:plastocyanin domain-containing protein
MNKTVSIIITIGFVIALGVIFVGGSNTGNDAASVENSEIRNGVQYITVTAKGGYTPRISSAKAGIPTKLIMKTNGAFDCSSSLVIRSIGFQEILPQTGETEIDLGIPKAGVPLEGVCGMGMYNFTINFI